MNELFSTSLFFGTVVTLGVFFLGIWLQKKKKTGLFNPMLISIVLTILILLIFRIDYSVYADSSRYVSFFMTPATICLAVPLYERIEILKKCPAAIILGVCSGVIVSIVSVFLVCLLFRLDHATYVTLLPKSITTAIGMGLSEELGGYPSLTVAAIVITGIVGNVGASFVCRIFRISHPVAVGVAIGTSSHALGTARALELGEIEGAMSGLSMVIAGLLTVALGSFAANFI